MEISYKKVARFMPVNEETTLRKIFWKSRYKSIKQSLSLLENNSNYKYGITDLTIDNLSEFSTLYQEEINKKFNPKIYDIVSIYKEKLKNKELLYFGYIWENDQLIAGYIFNQKISREKTTLAGGIKMGKDIYIWKSPILYLLEYLFFDFWIRNNIQQFSAGKDRNCYGYLGESIWLVVHKLQNHYLPYPSSEETLFYVKEYEINPNCLIFWTKWDIDRICSEATLWINKNWDEEELVNLLRKRGISLSINIL